MKAIANAITFLAIVGMLVGIGLLDVRPVMAVCTLFVSMIPLTVRSCAYNERKWRETHR